MAFEPSKHVNGRMWPPGVSGNPNGRPVGSRTAFSAGFLRDLAEVWQSHGRDSKTRKTAGSPGMDLSSQGGPVRGQATMMLGG